MLNSGLICTRAFNSFKPRNIFLRHKAFDRTHEQSRKHFLKHSLMTKCKLPQPNKSASSVCYWTAPTFCLSSLKFIENFLPSLLYHHESIRLLRSVLCLKFEKSPFPKICCEKDLQSLQRPESLKSSASFSKYLKHLKYLLKQKFPELCKQYSSCPTFYSSCFHSLLQDVFKCIQKTPKKLPKLQRNKTHKTSVHRDPCCPIFLHRVHWRGFHSSLFPLAKSDSNKSSACKKMDKICKPTEVKKIDECGRPCKEKNDVCRQEKVKCDKSQRNAENARPKPKTEKKMNPECRKTCLPIGKCELPHTVPPPKMEYAKVTCPSPKFAKPKPCPPVLENVLKDNKSRVETKQIRKKQICAPPPLPKPPYAPIVLCPCPPPRKVHPGPCPCYETKMIAKQPLIQPCPLKKKYPCPTGVHYCPLQKKSCNLKRETGCEHRKEKKASAP